MSIAERKASKWTSAAGPIQTKKVTDALHALQWHGKTRIEITDHGRMQFTQPFGEVSPEIVKALDEIGEQYGHAITRENYKAIIAACELAVKMNPIPEIDCRKTDEEKEQERIEREEIKRQQDEKAAQHKVEYDKAIAKLREKYPWATNDPKLSTHARCAANVREELRRTFPGHKFRVTSETFAGGNAIDVRWEMGPTDEEVKAITDKYTAGSFNGMEDIYEYDRSAYSDAVGAILGQIKYLHTHRSLDDAFEIVAKAVCERQGVEYAGRYQEGVFGHTDTRPLSAHVSEMFRDISFPAGAVVTGIADNSWEEWEAAGRPGTFTSYRITFDAPAVEADYTVDVSGPEREDGEKPFCYVIREMSQDKAVRAVIQYHKITHGTDDVILVSVIKGLPAADCGFFWNDLRGPNEEKPAGDYRIEKHHHTKRGFDFWLVVLNSRVDGDRFEQLRDSCEAAGGWYSRKWGRTPGGFGFRGQGEAEAWAASL